MQKISIKTIASIFSTDYSKGATLFAQHCIKKYQEDLSDDTISIGCNISDGFSTYEVVCKYNASSLTTSCTCKDFATRKRCPHIVAALIYHATGTGTSSASSSNNQSSYATTSSSPSILNQTSEVKSDENASKMLSSFLKHSSDPNITGSIDEANLFHLEPFVRFYDPSTNSVPKFSFKVGTTRLYQVKNVLTFIDNFKKQGREAFGKDFTLVYSEHLFDKRSQELIRLIRKEIDSLTAVLQTQLGNKATPNIKDEISFSPANFDQFFTLYVNEQIESRNNLSNISMKDENPKLSLQLNDVKRYVELLLPDLHSSRCFMLQDHLYFFSSTCFRRCDPECSKRLYPLVSACKSSFIIGLSDMSTFISCVLPVIEPYVQIKDPSDLISRYTPDSCTALYYFDIDNSALDCRLVFRYDDKSYDFGTTSTLPNRDISTETMAQNLLLQYMFLDPVTKHFRLVDDDAIFNFLSGTITVFQKTGEVYLSDAVQNKEIKAKKATVGISITNSNLLLDFDTEEFPLSELEPLYMSILLKKKYHKLADGRFLVLDGSSYETLAEIAHMIQLSPEDLKNGHVKLPSYRALYLDNLLSASETLHVDRDKNFRDMVARFKTINESDFQYPAYLSKILRPYQETGFRWLKTLEACGFGGILADEMGLGKTLQMITFLTTCRYKDTQKRNLIICPTSLVLNWSDEFTRFAPDMKVKLIIGTIHERQKLLGVVRMSNGTIKHISNKDDSDVWITSYDLLKRDIDLYRSFEFYCCILDEAQFVKNQSTQASKAVKAILCSQRFVMTGTPVENRLSELWNLFDFLMPGYLFSHNRFLDNLERPIIQNDNNDARLQLNRLVQPFMLRRLKVDVLKELPPKIEYVHRIALSEMERKVYAAQAMKIKQSFNIGSGKASKMTILASLTLLREICCDPSLCVEKYDGPSSKLEACLELIQSMVENKHQILVFSQFTSMLAIIESRLKKMGISSYTLQGSTQKERRAQLVRDFNAGGASVFLISLKAGGTGLNLTAADVVIHYDPWWNQAAQNQATDRAHRIGQQSCVNVYKLIAQDSIEERILELQKKKASLLDNLTEDNDQSILAMKPEELLALLD